MSPFQGFMMLSLRMTRGCAPGYYMSPLRGFYGLFKLRLRTTLTQVC
jgi:hypothetical protein